MHPDDMVENLLHNLDLVDINSHFNNELRTVEKFLVVQYPIPKGCSATYFPEANALVPIGSVADKSNTPTSKYIVITVEKHQQS